MRRIALTSAAAILLAAAPLRGLAEGPRTVRDDRPPLARARPQTATYFEANRGQTAAEVDFVARCAGYVAFLTPGAVTFKTDAAAIRMRFVGASATSRARGLEPAPGRSHYFIGNDRSKWTTDVPHVARVGYDSVLPGVDVAFRADGRALAYDLDLAPGADASSVRLKFEGADAVALNARGDVVLTIAGATATMSAPRARQDRDDVPCAFVVRADGEIGFAVGAHDASKRLVIDPTFTVATYLGGSLAETPGAITFDAAGDAYVAGKARSVDYPTTTGAWQPNRAGTVNPSNLYDAFLSEITPAGAFVFSTYIGGGGGDDGANDVAVDASGNAYVVGATTSADFPQVFADRSSGTGFIARLTSSGSSLTWSTFGGDARVGLDASSNVYVLGSNRVVKYDPATRARLFDVDQAVGTSGPILVDMSVTAAGEVWTAGSNQTNGQATPGALQFVFAGGATDGWLVHADATGAPTYATYLGGSGADVIRAVAVDADGAVYVACETTSTGLAAAGGVQTTNAGGQDAWIAKLNSSTTSIAWSTYLGTATNESVGRIAVGPAGELAVVGTTSGGGLPTRGAVQPAFGGAQDAFLTEFAPDGALAQSSYLGGVGTETGFGVAIDALGRVGVLAATSTSGLPTTSGACQPSYAGGTDAFVAVFPSAAAAFADLSPIVLAPATVGTPYSQPLSMNGGAPPFTWSSYGGITPPGLSLSTTGTLSGTPALAGTYVFGARVIDASVGCAARRCTLVVSGPPAITTTSLAPWTSSIPYSTQLFAAGGTPPLAWSLKTGALPPGAAIDSSGTISAPGFGAVGTFSFVVQVFDANASAAERALSIQINPPPRITGPDVLATTYLHELRIPFTLADGTPPIAWSVPVGSLPVDRAIDPTTGVLDGTSIDPGLHLFTVRATDAAGAIAEREYAVRVNLPPTIVTTDLPWAARGRPYSFAPTLAGGTFPFAWTNPSGLIAPGVDLDAASGRFAGTPQRAGGFPFVVRCTDGLSIADERLLDLVVADEFGIGAKADATTTLDYRATAGAGKFFYVELLAGAQLTVTLTRLDKGQFPLQVVLYDESQQVVFPALLSTTTKAGRYTIKKFSVPKTGRYFIELDPSPAFQGKVSMRVQAPPRTKWTGRASLDASGEPILVSFAAPAGSLFSAHVGPARGSKARPTFTSAVDREGVELFAASALRETKTAATFAPKSALVGGDVVLKIAPRGGFVGDVIWTATVKRPRKYDFALPDVGNVDDGK